MSKPMTRERLEQYRKAKEKADILNRLAGTLTSDKVKGSDINYPYTEHSITITGVDARLAAKIAGGNGKLKAEEECILTFLDEMEDSYLAQLIMARYVKNKSWVEIWKRGGCRGSVDAPRKMIAAYFKSLHS